MATSSTPVTELNEGETLTSSNSLLLVLLKPTAMESLGLSHKDETIKVHAFKTEVHQLKTHISRTWPGKPRLEGIRLIARGKILDDRELISVALSSTPGDEFTHPIHVVVRPNCWSEQVSITPTPTRPMSAPPTTAVDAGSLAGATVPISPFQQTNPLISSAALNPHDQTQSNPTSTPLPSLPHNPVTSTVLSPHHAIFTHFYNLTRPQRQAFIENLYKAQFGLVERLETLRLRLYQNQVEVLGLQMHPIQKSTEQDQLAKDEDEKWTVVDEKLTKLLVDLQYWGTYVEPYEPTEFHDYQLSYQQYQQNRPSEFERVEISGLPFLLHIPRNFQMQSNQEHFLRNIGTRVPPSTQVTTYKRLKKELNRTLHLEKRLQLLILQVKKLEASFSQLDGLMSTTNALVNNLSLGSLGVSSFPRLHNPPHLAGTAPVPAQQQAQGGLGRPPAAPAPGIIQLPPHGHLGLVGMGGGNPPALGVPGAGLPAAGAGLGVGPNGMIQMPAEWMMPPNGLAWPHVPMARTRRYEFTINLDNIRRYLAPLLWLSIKLGLLLYVFGRNASFNKRVILIGLAVGWVLWEAFAISQRYEAQARRRDRLQRQQAGAAGGGAVDPVQAVLDRGRRRAQRMREQRIQRDAPAPDNNNLILNLPPNGLANPTPTEPAAVPPPAPDSAAAPPPAPAPAAIEAPPAVDPQPARRRNLRAIAEQIRARGGAFPPGTEVRPFRTTSAFSPRYWFNSIAVVGLASEYRELGLHPIGERSLGSSNNLDYPNWYKFLRNLKICLILFFGTLSPEIEKKRKKALEKRTRILKMVIADAARERTNRPTIENHIPLVPIPNTPNQQSNENGVGVGNENPIDRETMPIHSSVVSASGVDHHSSTDGVHSTLVSRHRINKPTINEVNEPSNPLNSTESLPIVNNETRPTTSTTTTSPPTGSLPTIVIPPIAGPSTSTTSTTTSTSNHEENKTENLQPATGGLGRQPEEFVGMVEPPLTPSNERPGVVPGLDDTDDEDLVVGEDEAGMMLF